jgi:hypothetical protein
MKLAAHQRGNMTGNTFATAAVHRAAELIRTGIDPHTVRRQVHVEYPELTALGLDRALDLAREEITEQDSKAVLIPQTRTREAFRESLSESKC